jgi:hypothetical protein
MAKLLSKKEQSSTQDVSKFTQTKPPTKALLTRSSLLLFVLLDVCAVGPASGVLKDVNRPSFALRQALREAFFVRPPPILFA